MASIIILIIGMAAIAAGWTFAVVHVYRQLAADELVELGPPMERIDPARAPVTLDSAR